MNGILYFFVKELYGFKKVYLLDQVKWMFNIISGIEGKFTSIELSNMLVVSKPMITA